MSKCSADKNHIAVIGVGSTNMARYAKSQVLAGIPWYSTAYFTFPTNPCYSVKQYLHSGIDSEVAFDILSNISEQALTPVHCKNKKK